MNPLLRKEIRLLLPAWVIALLLAGVSPWMVTNPFNVWVAVWIGAIGAIILAVTAFGRESTLGTFSQMLAVPVPRKRVFKIKSLLLAAALVSVLGAFWLSYALRVERAISDPNWMAWLSADRLAERVEALRRERWQVLEICGAWAATVFAGGLWSALALRQMVAAFWVTIVVPGCLVMGATWLGVMLQIQNTSPLTVGALTAYSIVGLIGSWRLFQRAEDTPFIWSSRYLPSLRELTGARPDSRRHRPGRPTTTLLRQEISLHQVSLIGAGVLFLMNLGSIGVRASGMLPKTSDVYGMLELTGLFWFLIPLMLGASAISEERRLGTLEARLCLPVSQQRQYLLKLVVAIILGMLLGAAMFLLTEFLGHWLALRGTGLFEAREFGWLEMRNLALFYFGLILIGFYASSLSRSSLQALGAAIGIGLVGVLSIQLAVTGDWRGLVSTAWIPGALWATLFLVMMILAYRNFTHIHCGLHRVLRNVAVIVLSLSAVTALCSGIYWRAWELLTPLEPKHGAPVISGSGKAKMVTTFADHRLMILLPDGRLWVSEEARRVLVEESHYLVPTPGRFLEDSNWTDVAACYFQAIALRSEGTLWSIRKSELRNRNYEVVEEQVRQIGTEANWVAVAAGWKHLLALRDDGTLWGWGENSDGQLTGEYAGIVDEPVRIGEDLDWTRIFARHASSVAAKEDGTWWHWGKYFGYGEGIGGTVKTYSEPVRWDIDFDPSGVKALEATFSGGELMLREDGTLWAVGMLREGLFGYSRNYYTPQPVRVGESHLWEDIDNAWGWHVGLTTNGVLLQERGIGGQRMSSVSRYSDWIAVSGGLGGTITALAADGTICCWLASDYTGDALAPSRRPLTSFNIFDEQE